LDWLQSHPPDLSIFQVSRHLAVLLLLASGHRIHDLTLIDLDEDYSQILDKVIIFWPRFGSKQILLEIANLIGN
jgi:hypothetical protein